MTETIDEQQAIREAIALIDQGLGDFMHRDLVPTGEVSDLLLDMRTMLHPILVPLPEPDAALVGTN